MPIAGKPLIAWSILAAKGSQFPMRIVCSTDSLEIRDVATQWGAEAPFLRPDEFATDEASTLSVVLHALHELQTEFSHVLLLQPTSPLRTSADIDSAITEALKPPTDAVVSVSEAKTHPFLTFKISEMGELIPFPRPAAVSLRRQDLPPAFELNGAIYFNRVGSLLRDQTFLPSSMRAYPMPPERSVDIDDLADWELAEQLLLKQGESYRN